MLDGSNQGNEKTVTRLADSRVCGIVSFVHVAMVGFNYPYIDLSTAS